MYDNKFIFNAWELYLIFFMLNQSFYVKNINYEFKLIKNDTFVLDKCHSFIAAEIGKDFAVYNRLLYSDYFSIVHVVLFDSIKFLFYIFSLKFKFHYGTLALNKYLIIYFVLN